MLADELGLEMRRVGSGNRLTFCDGEKRLSEWLGGNAFVTWEVTPEPWLLEQDLIHAVPLPLNLDQNASHTFCATLAGIRRAARETARALPLWKAEQAHAGGHRSRLFLPWLSGLCSPERPVAKGGSVPLPPAQRRRTIP
jgi:hypothetical protein